MVTLHPTSKAFGNGYIPMITMRGARGRMIGSKTPQGDARDWRTFPDKCAAEIDARVIALRVAARNPDMIQVAE